ncbi:MAG: phosphoglycerate kinase [Candidatus Pacebacteria bacterium]|nr:phosphoglycerate kinase [Candidatus Paceibacterota bacterium]MBP9867021.1 phosphoglycerate kinase [Candidatus Paceibacterota bacterium]
MNQHWKNHILPEISTFNNKTVLVRVDFNLPITDGEISDTSRFDITVPFLKELSFHGAKVILLTHFGEKGESLEIIAKHVTNALPFVSFFPSNDFSVIESKARSLARGEAILLENVRMWKGELDNTPSLARSFSQLGEVFINDAFSVSHREHASVVGIPHLMISYFGPTFTRELENLTKALQPAKPALFIIGGSKISTKLSLIDEYLNRGVEVFVGGAMVHNIWKERGIEIGKSFYDQAYELPESFYNHPLLLTPKDVVLSTGNTVPYNEIPKDGIVVDCGNATVEYITKEIDASKTVIANGPLGLYEKGWLHGSEQILTHLAHSSAVSYIGGGDTVSVAHTLKLLRSFNFVSLGGGAMLDFLANGTLPGIDAVTK